MINFPLNDAWGFGIIDFQEFMICDSTNALV